MITIEQLRELLHYEPETGIFTRLKTTNNNGAKAGTIAAVSNGGQGHLITRIAGRKYYLHRLAWFYVHGRWPAHVIDHINGDPTDNRLVNLRDIPQSVNMQNQRAARKDNTHGFMGVTRNHKRFLAQIQIAGRYHYLGTYDTPEQAHAAYVKAKRELHEGGTL